jgi:hypothetical protein
LGERPALGEKTIPGRLKWSNYREVYTGGDLGGGLLSTLDSTAVKER